jgi:hypothetical protein
MTVMMPQILAVLFLLSAAKNAGAQQASSCPASGETIHAKSSGKYAFFLEPSSFGFPLLKQTIHAPPYFGSWRGNDFDDVIYEAFVATHIFIHNGVSVPDVQLGTCGGWSKVWTFTPFFRLRQLGSYSSPLRTPSFMPRFLSLQLLNVARYGKGYRPSNWTGGIRIWEMHFLFQHHSNGGPKCLFVEDQIVNDRCFANIPPAQRTVDTSGSFSTDFAEVRGSLLQGHVGDNGLLEHSWTATAAAEFHSRWLVFLPGYIQREQMSVYGPYRIKLGGEYQHVAFTNFKWVSGATAQYIFYEHKPNVDASPITFETSTALISDDISHFWRGWGVRLRYYQGQDYYNLFFFRDIRRLFVEVVIDPRSQHLLR